MAVSVQCKQLQKPTSDVDTLIVCEKHLKFNIKGVY